MSTRPTALLLLAVSLVASTLVACAGGSTEDGGVDNASSEVRSAEPQTIEGAVLAGGATGFVLSASSGTRAHEVALDLTVARLPGQLLAGKTLRVSGRIEKRAAAQPGGDAVIEVLVATEVIERTDRAVKIQGTLGQHGAVPVIVERTPKDAPTADQTVIETLIELPKLASAPPFGAEVTVRGKLANRFIGTVSGDNQLMSQELVLVEFLDR